MMTGQMFDQVVATGCSPVLERHLKQIRVEADWRKRLAEQAERHREEKLNAPLTTEPQSIADVWAPGVKLHPDTWQLYQCLKDMPVYKKQMLMTPINAQMAQLSGTLKRIDRELSDVGEMYFLGRPQEEKVKYSVVLMGDQRGFVVAVGDNQIQRARGDFKAIAEIMTGELKANGIQHQSVGVSARQERVPVPGEVAPAGDGVRGSDSGSGSVVDGPDVRFPV